MKRFKRHKLPFYPWVCWFIAALLYLLQYSLLIFPSVFNTVLQAYFRIDATAAGVLFSAFLYTYVLMQIPAGIIFDRFRSRDVLVLASFAMALGCVLFIFSSNIWVALLARMVMGFGGSFAFIGALYLGRNWFPVMMFPFIVGLTEAMSGISEIGFLPLMAFLKNLQSWRMILFEMFLATIILGVLILFFVREHHPEQKKYHKIGRSDFNLVFKNSAMWLLSIYVGMMFAFDMVIANMWGVPMLMERFGIPTWKAAVESGVIMVGFTVGCYAIAWIARAVSNHLLIMMIAAILQFITMWLFWYWTLNLTEVAIMVSIIGFTSSAMVLAFDVAKKMIPEASYGLASGFLNMFFGGAGIIVSPIVGYVFQVTNDINAALIPVIVCSAIAGACGIILKFKKIVFLQ